MKKLLIAITLIPLIAFSNEYEYKDNRGRTIEEYSEKEDIIEIKDVRGRTTRYIKDENIYDNRGRKQGSFILKKDLLY